MGRDPVGVCPADEAASKFAYAVMLRPETAVAAMRPRGVSRREREEERTRRRC
jgi:hypothetical protein